MRQLNNIAKALGLFLSDPAAHVTAAWATVRAAIDPEAAKKPGPLRDALVVCDTAMAAVSGFLNSDPAAGAQGGELMDADLRASIELYAVACGLPVQGALVQAERLLSSPMATVETIMRRLKALDVAPPKNTTGRPDRRPDRPIDVAKIHPWTTQRGRSR